MKEVLFGAPGAIDIRQKRTLLENWSRRSVFASLSALRGGQLTVEEGSETHVFGPSGGLSARVRVCSSNFYRRLIYGGDLGAAEAFMNQEWTTDDLFSVLRIFARDAGSVERIEGGWSAFRGVAERLFHLLRRNSERGSAHNIHAHYDLGNDFFKLFLDETMNYSAGIFESPTASLKDASIAKMDRACRKLDLGPKDHLLEIGTGWGGMAMHAASRYGCLVTTTTISAEQHELASQRVKAAGLESQVTVLREDYRQLFGTFDKLISIEMIEAVGHEFLDTYFRQCGALLKPDGLMLLQAIVTPDHRYNASRKSVDFIRRYIFPGSCLTSISGISSSIGRTTNLRIAHVEDIAPHYGKTLRQWRRNFLGNLDNIRRLGYDDRFLRMWEYYLCYSEAGFEERIVGDVQMLLEGPASQRPSILGRLEGRTA